MEEVTLLFRHLPAELNLAERKDLLYYLGASQVKVMGKSGPMKNTAFAVFGSKEQATQVLNQLHQVDFLGSRLVVEFAKTQLPRNADSLVGTKGPSKESGTIDEEDASIKREEDLQQQIEPREIKFDTTFYTWSLKHPRRPELRYAYPPPTSSILTNILNALAAVPKFYVQVLHLMNKMDLPAPFGAVTPAPPLNTRVRELTLPDDVDQQEMEISSEYESELESGDENQERIRLKELHPRKRLSNLAKKRIAKRPKLSDLHDGGVSVTPSTAAVPTSQVFEMMAAAHAGTKKIELKLPSSIAPTTDSKLAPGYGQRSNQFSVPPHLPQSYLAANTEYLEKTPTEHHLQQQQSSSMTQAHLATAGSPAYFPAQQHQLPLPTLYDEQHVLVTSVLPNVAANTALVSKGGNSETSLSAEQNLEQEVSSAGGFGILQPVLKEPRKEEEEESADKEWSRSKFISSSELRRSRLSHSEMKELSIFKNYDEGEASCRLYIKNLARNVTEEDIHWVYGRYVDWDSEIETNIFDIKLMKEGRMKGQAFVTLPTEKSAISAVKDTNGFLLKDKPMVVQFARSAKVKQ